VRAAWRAHPQTIEALAVSRDGRFLASVGNDGLAHVWSTAEQTEVATLIGHKGRIFSVAFTPDGARLATGGADDLTIRIWDLPAVCRIAK
jgi:WD40 repeat protein